MKTIQIFIICIPLILLSLGIVFGLTFVQDHLNQDEKEAKNKDIFLKYLISTIIAVVLNIINTIIGFLIEFLLEYATTSEKQISRSNYILSLSIKITIFTFLNSAIVPLISKHFVLLI